MKKITLLYEYESIKERKFKCKGIATVGMTEQILLCSHGAFKLPEMMFANCPGSNKGPGVGPLKVTPYSKCWCLRFEQKKPSTGR